METSFHERDWKVLSINKEKYLDALCQKIVSDISDVLNGNSSRPYDKYIAVYKLIQNRDRVIADIFNRWSRSQMRNIIIGLIDEGILDKQMVGYSDDAKEAIRQFLQITGRG